MVASTSTFYPNFARLPIPRRVQSVLCGPPPVPRLLSLYIEYILQRSGHLSPTLAPLNGTVKGMARKGMARLTDEVRSLADISKKYATDGRKRSGVRTSHLTDRYHPPSDTLQERCTPNRSASLRRRRRSASLQMSSRVIVHTINSVLTECRRAILDQQY